MNTSSPVIFLAFANNLKTPQAYLHMLKREGNNIYSKLWPHREKQAIDLHKVDNASIQDIFQVLTELFPDKVSIFHYGGHADGGHLQLESDSGSVELAQADGLAALLGKQEQLQLVFLNGCSTLNQVKLLLEAGVKAVIATSTLINDSAAVEFAEQFYASLAKGANVERAFSEAKALVATKYQYSKGLALQITPYTRSLFYEEAPSSTDFPWGLYINEEHRNVLQWKLPSMRRELSLLLNPKRIKPAEEVNDYIILPVFEKIREHLPHLGVPLDEDDDPDELKIQDLIIENFPLPIGEQIRKLFATTEEMFTFSLVRLQQIIRTYEVVTKFVAYVMISQLWDKITNEEDLSLPEKQQANFNSFFSLDPENFRSFDFMDIIQAVIEVFQDKGWEMMIEEAKTLQKTPEPDLELVDAYSFLQHVREEIADEQVLASDLEEFCREGEFHLANVLKDMSFLSTYRLISIKDIVLKKDRLTEPAYSIHMGVLRGTDSRRIKVKAREYEGYTDSQSVLLVKNVKNIVKYQSLSPFIFDENAFTGHPSAKIFFYSYAQQESFFYDFVDQDDELLEINKEQYPHIQAQFERFRSEMP